MTTMKRSTKNLETSVEAYQWVKAGYQNAHKAKLEGRPVAWLMFGVPLEIIYTMGIIPIFPENYGTLCAAKRVGYKYCEAAEQHGFDKQICSYARTVTGYTFHPDTIPEPPAGGLALPDILIAPTAVCDLRQKWFEDVARRLDIPVYFIGMPDNDHTWKTGRPEKYLTDLFISEVKDLIKFLEKTLDKKFDEDEFVQRWHWGNEAWDIRLDILELRKNIPAPLSSADYFASIFPGMTMLGTQEAVDFYKRMHAEVKERVEKKISVVPEEKFRLMWSGIPIWFNLGLLNYPEDLGGVMSIETNYQALPRERSDDPYMDLALRHFAKNFSLGVDSQVDLAMNFAQKYNIDGVILSYTQSCRPFYIFQAEVRNNLQEKLGIPCLMLESDMADERAYSEGQVRTRMDAFLEIIMKKKESQLIDDR
ncbi:MAG: 2-hydroxyacyl-CoA dehydratase family protein [Pseudomonadota bacterium]